MAMMISKFHRLIQSRLLWIVFLVGIVFSFVIWGMVTPGRARDAEAARTAGFLDGDPVTHDAFHRAYAATHLRWSMMMGGAMDSSLFGEELRREAWQRLAGLRAAEQAGFRVDEEQTADAIRQYPLFTDQEGRFDPQRYQAFTFNVLRPMRVTPYFFETFIAEELKLGKLRRMLHQAALISPLEVERALAGLTDTFDLTTVVIPAAKAPLPPAPTAAQLRARYDADPAEFTLPRQVQVQTARLPIADFLDRVEVSDEAIEDYYYRNRDEFMLPPGEEHEDQDGEQDEDLPPTPRAKPLEDVRDIIHARLLRRAAEYRAVEEATEFVVALARDGRMSGFDTLAREKELDVIPLAPFAEHDVPPEVDAGTAFTRAAFRLRRNPSEYFSDAVTGRDYVYVMALEQRMPERVPEFTEALDTVREVLTAELQQEYLHAWAQELRDVLSAPGATSLAERLEPHGLTPRSHEGLQMAQDMEERPETLVLIERALAMNTGEWSEPFTSGDDRMLLRLDQRTPGDPLEKAMLREEITQYLRQERGNALYEEWLESLVGGGRLRDLLEDPPTRDDDDYDDLRDHDQAATRTAPRRERTS